MDTEHTKLPKLIVVLGPTAAGKTAWALRLAQELNGEIIGADSRQIYKKMDVGTAKPEGEWRRNGLRRSFMVGDIPHHIIDIIDPGKRFSVAEFRDKAVKYVKLIHKSKKIPIVVGGTGLYISSLVDNLHIPRVSPNRKLRQSLEEKSIEDLFALFERMDPEGAQTIDRNNKRRLLRALEVCILSGEPFSVQKKKGEPLFDVLQIGVSVSKDELYRRIEKRVDTMIKLGLVKEVEQLLKQKYAWHLPSMSGVGYRQFQEYFEQGKDLDECIALLKRDTRRFARRQLTWFRRDDRITWCSTYEEAAMLAKEFLQE
ncbi:MAG: tRNA dimethylallyltransferase [Candidatus Magasanikbacteria bacterium GW2011_GWD2_43_18]|uniref:tRNA dimethylallyltransferase n=1 Tax=Candidatus Magasanikbacteria bacterium GW2011_GWE2_42_7 TaxID=1619052 RepID=A0A0G1DPQ4_9BACT|nr:MAG: tRNA dimethylallyltransferase [Candidatus Magasanikbacteria bacterium GW2011_GWC2_42_27]KKS72806.1 MAG: tRNA dimethylallyltransferase [Candidatus Magasanikbacteria bacterium GW2011_GWE2_42_7]KKT04028.1 MAG: tRNA dimethylallyltransferase [Candidatus Magasanikbacteria bacterium GW2011_GWD2_43_18]KKT24924.1 MAG: tRNA dimethylallyltransferase [Candidatus Magasanikbacteria bacterium GW2011_GWA2_43_9]HBB37939.1 tRNA (adenosine(37)-N6)-dimethylallyltransferase MiaA [Candidatus Magasanikbacteri